MNKREILITKIEKLPDFFIDRILHFIQIELESKEGLDEIAGDITVRELELMSSSVLKSDPEEAEDWEDMPEEI